MVQHHHLLDGYSGMTLITFQNGKPVFRDGKVGTEQGCCCGKCCCTTITLNDLLYGNKPYSWPTIKPASKNRAPQFGTMTDPPVPPEYASWTDLGNGCYERFVPFEVVPPNIEDPAVQADYCGTGKCGLMGAAQQDEVWGCIERHCFRSWKPYPACLTWVCRCVDQDGNVTCEQIYGASINNKNLSELVTDSLGPETESGCYVYTIEFFEKRLRVCKENAINVQDDSMYTIYKTEVTC